MKKYSKPLWIDTIIAIIGIVITLIASFNILGFIHNQSDIMIINYINLIIGVIIILWVLFKRKGDPILIKVDKEKLYNLIQSELPNYNNIFIYNPNNKFPYIKELIESLNASKHNIAISGDASYILSLLNLIKPSANVSKFTHVHSFKQDTMLITFYNEKTKKILILYFNNINYFIIKIFNKQLYHELIKNFSINEEFYKNTIRLEKISQPPKFLEIVHHEKEKYLDNFINLKSGYISFFGTEILNIQSGWLESGKFKTIRTLDLTVDPSIILTRHRYIKANKEFINSNGGIIKRIFLIKKSDIENIVFLNNLLLAIKLQKDMGVLLGIQSLDELIPEEKQDFILYDDFSVLIEEKQANSDYSFGKSTAYFDKNKIKKYEELFENIWNGKNQKNTALENLNNLLLKK